MRYVAYAVDLWGVAHAIYELECDGTTNVWEGIWALRVTARPFSRFALTNIAKQSWLQQIDTRAFNGTGQIRQLGWRDLNTTRAWAPRLRAVEREFEGTDSLGLDRVGSDGLIERFIWQKQPQKGRPSHGFLDILELHWNVACVVHAASLIRAVCSRPTQNYGLELELLTSDPLLIHGYHSSPNAKIPAGNTTFQHYEIGDPQTLDEPLSSRIPAHRRVGKAVVSGLEDFMPVLGRCNRALLVLFGAWRHYLRLPYVASRGMRGPSPG